MSEKIKVLFLAAEADPFVKVGSLGDVAGSLPLALRALSPDLTNDVSVDVRLVLPFHQVLRSSLSSLRPLTPFPLQRGEEEVIVEVFESTHKGLTVYFVGGGAIETSGSIYSANLEKDGEKYTFFSLAVLELIRHLGWYPDVVHANDWHTALVAYGLLVQHWQAGKQRPASLLTVHNLTFLGPDVDKVLESYEVPLAQTDLPDWARLKPMPLGLWAADAIVAVSPTYANEILSPEFGSNLDEFISTRNENLSGILNGIDISSYDPGVDENIAVPYTIDALNTRSENKTALANQVGLLSDHSIPLFGVVSRMDRQKGIDLIIRGLRKMVASPWQAIILGTGDPKLEQAARKLAEEFPERVRFEAKYDAKLARQIYAGADILLMPSRYEPCGLSQMIAMRYGCIPIVHAVGGLNDTVTDGETGFVFNKPTVKYFTAAIQRALETFQDKDAWITLQQNGMQKDFSWTNSAFQYFELYKRLIANRN